MGNIERLLPLENSERMCKTIRVLGSGGDYEDWPAEPSIAEPKTIESECLVSHSSLIEVAAKWLQRKCAVVITELGTTGETPDAVDWHGTHSMLVECKVSRADFIADKRKWFRREEWRGIGMQRYFLSVPGIINLEELPAKWGWLELTGSRVRIMRLGVSEEN